MEMADRRIPAWYGRPVTTLGNIYLASDAGAIFCHLVRKAMKSSLRGMASSKMCILEINDNSYCLKQSSRKRTPSAEHHFSERAIGAELAYFCSTQRLGFTPHLTPAWTVSYYASQGPKKFFIA